MAAGLDVLVGAHGAGLTNGVFLPGGTGELLEVAPWGLVAAPYGALAAAVGVGHALHAGHPDVGGVTACLLQVAARADQKEAAEAAATAAAAAAVVGGPAAPSGGATTAPATPTRSRTAAACTALAAAYTVAAGEWERRGGGAADPPAGEGGAPDGGARGWRIAAPSVTGGCPAAYLCARTRPIVVDVGRLEADVLAAVGRVCARRKAAAGG